MRTSWLTQPVPPPNSLDHARLCVAVATIVLNVAVVGLLVWAPWSNWRTGLALNLLDNLILGGFAFRYRDRFLEHLLAFGIVVGIVELLADAWLVDFTRTLDYSLGGGPMLWRSPLWMPLAWQIVAVQFAVVGERWRYWKPMAGLALTGLLGAINIPYYEEMARRINWWTYSGCRMISGTPYYIIVGEFFIAAGLAWLATPLRRLAWSVTLGAGVAGGLLIFVAYAIAYLLTDRTF